MEINRGSSHFTEPSKATRRAYANGWTHPNPTQSEAMRNIRAEAMQKLPGSIRSRDNSEPFAYHPKRGLSTLYPDEKRFGYQQRKRHPSPSPDISTDLDIQALQREIAEILGKKRVGETGKREASRAIAAIKMRIRQITLSSERKEV